jgi:gluconolactonase
VSEVERLTEGYQLAEAPVATPAGGVVFSDVLGGGVHEWDPATGEVTVVIPKRRGVGGMAHHRDGGLVVSGRDVSLVADGESRALYVPDEGSGITGINDLTVDPDGHVVVGHLRFRPFAGESPVPGEFVTVDAGGRPTDVIGDVLWTNGCAFSPDGRVFYGCDYQRGVVLAADRREDGSYGPSRIAVASPSGEADGMAVDESGALWVALGARASIGRFTPDGHLDSEVEVPTGFVASLCFGGRDGRDLFITTAARGGGTGAVFRTRAPVAGAPLFLSAG